MVCRFAATFQLGRIKEFRLTSRILLLPLRSSAQDNSSSYTEALEAVLVNNGHFVACSEREQVSEQLLEDSNAVFLEVLREDDLAFFLGLRNKSRKPVLVYGAGVPKSMQIESMKIGADAFLCLPDKLEVLEARVHAFLRRAGLEPFLKDVRDQKGVGAML